MGSTGRLATFLLDAMAREQKIIQRRMSVTYPILAEYPYTVPNGVGVRSSARQ